MTPPEFAPIRGWLRDLPKDYAIFHRQESERGGDIPVTLIYGHGTAEELGQIITDGIESVIRGAVEAVRAEWVHWARIPGGADG